eukprot:TRINITY_DN50702_c0_g1_i1.p1 TRINITY_DN50702_c0_g1~~TRINITY_DN50702_c0_g1_i1.p1  ORF type:complete len:150 (+),score=28.09 TRINITY_DN50702_c0_g1_i1:97-546(+)
MLIFLFCIFFFQAEDGIRDAQESRGLGDVYKRQGMDCEERAMMNEDVTVDIGPSQSSPSSSKRKSISGSKASSSSSALSQKGAGKSTVHKNSSQYRLLEDLRAEIRFYEAERITLYSRLYGLKENGGMVPAPHVSSVLKPATMLSLIHI